MFEHANNWEWMWLLTAVAMVGIACEVSRRRALWRFIGEHSTKALRQTTQKNAVTLIGELLAMLLLVAALADPRWGHHVEQLPEPQTQVVFAVDVSRSMLAEDAQPSRLDCARTLVANCLGALDGERVALVDFAGNARTAAPLTRNHAEIKAKLDALRATDRLIGGSELKSAVQAGCDAFLHRMPGDKVLVVLTDGEDHGTADVAEIASVANDCGCRTLIVGIGDPVTGARIPVAETASGPQYLTYKGETIVSRRNDALLEQLALLTHGVYVATNGGELDLASVYREQIEPRFEAAHRSRSTRVGVARFPWFLAAALLLLLSSRWLRGSRNNSARNRWDATTAARALVAMAALAIGLGASVDDVVRRANRDFRAGRWDEAIAAYERAATLGGEAALPTYNQAVTYYRAGDRAAARGKLREMLAAGNAFAARAEFLLGNCDYADVVAGGLAKDQSIAQLQNSIGHYRRALAAQADWDDPRINIELAQMLIEEIKHAPEVPQNSQESGDEGKAGSGENDKSTPQGPGQNPSSANNNKQQAKSPPQQNGDGSKGDDSLPQSKGNGNAGTPQSDGANAGGSSNSPPNGGGNANSKSPDNPSPDRNEAQQKLDKIMQQARQRESQRNNSDGRPPVEVDKNW